MGITAQNRVIQIKYEYFSYTHQMYYLYMILLIIHGIDLWLTYLPLTSVVCGSVFLINIYDALLRQYRYYFYKLQIIDVSITSKREIC